MALTETQKASVRRYLGFGRGRDIHPELESRFVGWLSTEEETQISATLTQLDALMTKLQSAALENTDLQSADKGDAVFFGPEQLRALRDHGRMLVQTLATIFEVEPRRDVFGMGPVGGLVSLG